MSTDKQPDGHKVLRHEDPITGEKGAHPVGTAVGAALAGVTAGAVAGTVAGPIGTLVGALAGGLVGGYAGKAVAEYIDPTVEVEYWRSHYSSRPYFRPDVPYESYETAYRFGWSVYEPDRSFAEREVELERRWNEEVLLMDRSTLSWEQARAAIKDAYERVFSSREHVDHK
jgi:hypothetical protein